jgi:ankyrin repeat protein
MRNLALNSLAWIIHAQRPLEIEELQYALAIGMKSKDEEDIELCLPEVDVILGACGNLLEKVNDAIRPIHYTVQEFLIDATQQSPEGTIQAQLLDLNSMHTKLSLACLEYIHETPFENPVKDAWYYLYERLIVNPFASYACQSFDYHIAQCSPISEEVTENLEKLLLQDGLYLAAVLQIKVFREAHSWTVVENNFNSMQFPVTAATIVSSTSLCDIPALRQRWTNESSPRYALHLAVSGGRVRAVLRLLEAGCDIHERDAEQSTPLYRACFNTNLDIVEMLLDAGAETNAQGGRLGNALQAASYQGHEPIVKLILDSGADVNAREEGQGCALYVASCEGHEPVVRLLLDSGADVNAQGGEYVYALHAASYKGHEPVVRLLLEAGADINVQGGEYRTALQEAIYKGHEPVVRLLLEAGADINVQGGEYRTALQEAIYKGREQIVKLLLEAGADVTTQSGLHGTALQAASFMGYEQTVKLLLEAGADVNARGGKYGSALQAASFNGKKQIVKLLLKAGADVNAQGGEYGSALRAALSVDGKQAVKLPSWD